MMDANELYFRPMQYKACDNCTTEFTEASAKEITCLTTAMPATVTDAVSYVPVQMDTSTYDDVLALQEGTLFPALNKPFLGSEQR